MKRICSCSLFAPGFLQVRLYPQSQHAFHSSEHRNAPDKKEGGVLCSSLGWQAGGLFCVPCLDLRSGYTKWWVWIGGMELGPRPCFLVDCKSFGRLLRSFSQGLTKRCVINLVSHAMAGGKKPTSSNRAFKSTACSCRMEHVATS